MTADIEANSDVTCLGMNCIHDGRTDGVPNLLRVFDGNGEHWL